MEKREIGDRRAPTSFPNECDRRVSSEVASRQLQFDPYSASNPSHLTQLGNSLDSQHAMVRGETRISATIASPWLSASMDDRLDAQAAVVPIAAPPQAVHQRLLVEQLVQEAPQQQLTVARSLQVDWSSRMILNGMARRQFPSLDTSIDHACPLPSAPLTSSQTVRETVSGLYSQGAPPQHQQALSFLFSSSAAAGQQQTHASQIFVTSAAGDERQSASPRNSALPASLPPKKRDNPGTLEGPLPPKKSRRRTSSVSVVAGSRTQTLLSDRSNSLSEFDTETQNNQTSQEGTCTADSTMGLEKDFLECGSFPLAHKAIDRKLSSYQAAIRQQLEIFVVDKKSINRAIRGRKKPVRVGQVGVRCKHCKRLPHYRQEKGASYFPTDIQGVYQAAQNIARVHLLEACKSIDKRTRTQLRSGSSDGKSPVTGGKQEWVHGCMLMGIYEAADGHGLRIRNRSSGVEEDER